MTAPDHGQDPDALDRVHGADVYRRAHRSAVADLDVPSARACAFDHHTRRPRHSRTATAASRTLDRSLLYGAALSFLLAVHQGSRGNWSVVLVLGPAVLGYAAASRVLARPRKRSLPAPAAHALTHLEDAMDWMRPTEPGLVVVLGRQHDQVRLLVDQERALLDSRTYRAADLEAVQQEAVGRVATAVVVLTLYALCARTQSCADVVTTAEAGTEDIWVLLTDAGHELGARWYRTVRNG